MRSKILIALILLAATTLCVRAQQSIQFEFPLSCRINNDCWIINYVDNDPSPNWHDYKGKRFTYDEHKGTDIAIKNLNKMHQGVGVLAAANGVVIATRDSMPDVNSLDSHSNANLNNACGNRVGIKHTGGWITDYCHLKRGSVLVKKGDYVKTGQKIGEIGLSGLTEFPHLHFSVQKDKDFYDPFTGRERYSDTSLLSPLWSASALQKMRYKPHIVYNIGISEKAPDWLSMRRQKSNNISSDSPALILWVDAFHVEAGDIFEMTITNPARATFIHKKITIDKSNAKKYLYVGKKRPANGFKKGNYRAKVTLKRPNSGIYQTETLNFRVY